jgi:alpha-glucosidase
MRHAGRAVNGVFQPLALLLSALSLAQIAAAQGVADNLSVSSPNGQLKAVLRLDDQGRPHCDVTFRQSLVASAALGLEFAEGGPLQAGLKVVGARPRTHDETYAIPVGKSATARDHYAELVVALEEEGPSRRQFDVVVRAFDDGIAFRYVIKRTGERAEFTLTDELTRLTFPGDPAAHILPLAGFATSYEAFYETSPVSQLGADKVIGLPMLLERRGGDGQSSTWIAVTEANLKNYAGMFLSPASGAAGEFAARLSPLPNREDGANVTGQAPLATPWRVLMIADDPGRLIESHIVLNLSDPSRIADPSWIKPGKTTFPWWNGYVLEDVDFKAGLNTATHKHYIDFCAEHGFEYHSLDGTDVAWYGGPIVPDGPTDVTKAVPEIDLPELLRYAKEKGVRLRLWMHWRALQPQLDQAFPLYEQWGIEGVMIDFMDRDDQEMMAFYHEVAEKAAQHKLTVTWHGSDKPAGMERTWPNVLNYEAALNQEYDKWNEQGVSPRHNIEIAMIRMLAGPVDYHLGGMRNVLPDDFKPRNDAPLVQGTRCHQLALYVVLENHLPMLVDYPAAYRGQTGLDFLASVPTNWDETRVLHAEFGKCLVIARRNGAQWYIGGLAADAAHALKLSLDFLPPGDFQAELWLDKPDDGATAVTRRDQAVSRSAPLDVSLSSFGGFVARLTTRP